MKYEQLIDSIMIHLGGKDNIKNMIHCMTRLRVNVYDESKVDVPGLEATDAVMNVQLKNNQYQIVIGTEV